MSLGACFTNKFPSYKSQAKVVALGAPIGRGGQSWAVLK